MLLERLKTETLPQHRSIEAVLPIPSTGEEYAKRLEGFLGFVEPWEAGVTQALRARPEVIEGRLKAEALREDLRALGYSDRQILALPRCENLPSSVTEAEALGSMYVMEGSTLGGQFIVRQLRSTLGLGSEATRYFSSYGPEVGKRWQEFRQHLQNFSSAENDNVMVESARQTFVALENWFSGVPANRVD